MTGWSEGRVTANGIKIHYFRTGGDKPPVVLSHGFNDNGRCWTRVAMALERDYDVLMPDARGHGLSDAPEQGYSSEVLAADLAAFVVKLSLREPVLMGHSMGAATTATTAVEYPHLVASAVLEDPPWMGASLSADTQSALNRVTMQKAVDRRKMTAAQLRALLWERHPQWHPLDVDAWVESRQQWSPNAGPAASGTRRDWRADAPRIACPTLLIAAEQESSDPGTDSRPLEGIVSRHVAEEAMRLNRRIQVAHIADAGHSIHCDQFERYMEAVTAFLGEVRSRAGKADVVR